VRGPRRRRRRCGRPSPGCGSSSRKKRSSCAGMQSDDVQGGDVQRMAVSPLGELRPRPGRCAGRSRAVREELQCGGCKRIRTGALGPRVGDIGGRRGEGNGRHGPDVDRPQPSRRRRGGYDAASRKERRRSKGGDRMRRVRRSHGAVKHGELPSFMRRSGQEQRGAGSTRSARPAVVVDRS
jgi:hypothetical protein